MSKWILLPTKQQKWPTGAECKISSRALTSIILNQTGFDRAIRLQRYGWLWAFAEDSFPNGLWRASAKEQAGNE